MAVGKPKFPLEKVSGVLGKKDRSIGKEPGLSLNITDCHGKTILGLKTAATQTRSPGQTERSATYCYCDCEWKKLSPQKVTYCQTFHTKVRRLSYYHMTNYLCWMSLCMSSAWSETAFLLNSYISRYIIKNTTGQTWSDKKVLLTGINTKLETGTDITVLQTGFYRQPMQTLSHKVGTPGTAIICLPEMAPSDTIYVDVYSYGDYSTPQNCPALSEADLNTSMLENSNMVPYSFKGATNVDVSFVAQHTGPLYMMYCGFYMGGGTQVDLSTNTPLNQYIGDTGKNFYGIPLYIWGFGTITAGQSYTINGHITEPDSGLCYGEDCGVICFEFNYYGSLSKHKARYYPGVENNSNPGYYSYFEMIQLIGQQYTQITPESIIKIGPT
jgi:hypothetical protein